MIFSGGLSYDTVGRRPCLTVMHGKSTAVLEMDYPIVDFLTLCETPYPNGNSLTAPALSNIIAIRTHSLYLFLCHFLFVLFLLTFVLLGCSILSCSL